MVFEVIQTLWIRQGSNVSHGATVNQFTYGKLREFAAAGAR